MAEINLLKQNTGNNFYTKLPKLVAGILFLLLALLVVYYFWQFFHSKNTTKKILAVQQQIVDKKQEAMNFEDRDEVLTRQVQIKSLEDIVAHHYYWSQIFSPLAEAALKSASYTGLNAGIDGLVTLDVNVPTLEDLDKYMQVFDLGQFNKNFSDIRIGAFSKTQGPNGSSVKFKVEMKYRPDLILYSKP